MIPALEEPVWELGDCACSRQKAPRGMKVYDSLSVSRMDMAIHTPVFQSLGLF